MLIKFPNYFFFKKRFIFKFFFKKNLLLIPLLFPPLPPVHIFTLTIVFLIPPLLFFDLILFLLSIDAQGIKFSNLFEIVFRIEEEFNEEEGIDIVVVEVVVGGGGGDVFL